MSFNETIAKTLELTRKTAQNRGLEETGTEHLLTNLIEDPAVRALVMKLLENNLMQDIAREHTRKLGKWNDVTQDFEHTDAPYSKRMKEALNLAESYAMSKDQNEADGIDLLIGILEAEESDNPARKILERYGITLQRTKAELDRDNS